MPELAFTANDRGDLLSDLTDAQRQAVAWNEGPLLVLAGPGSGKTNVLTRRIARLLQESGDRRYRILGLTFTNKAADEMRMRVERMASEHTERLFLGTFHSFCASVLRQHGSHLGIRPDFRIYSTREDLDAILKSVLESLSGQEIAVAPGDAKLIPVIQNLRAQLVAPADAPQHVADESLAERITAIYEGYDGYLRQNQVLDFDSIIYYAVSLFRQFPVIAKHYQKVYRYWCIDEFQDTNHAQYELIRTMAGGQFKDLFAVADDDQLIYEWNGASHERIDELIRDFDPRLVQLAINFRCPPQVVKLANRLIVHNTRRLVDKLPLEANKASVPDAVRLLSFESDNEESHFIAEDIARRHSRELHKVAILARRRALLDRAKHVLDERGIRAVLVRRHDTFTSAPYLWLDACLRQSNRRRETKNLSILCATFAELTGIELDPGNVMAEADASYQDYLRQWAELASRYSGPGGEAARKVMELLVRATDYGNFIDFANQWFPKLIGDPSAENDPRFPGYEDDRRAWNELYRDLRGTVGQPLETFLQELDLRSKEPSPRDHEVRMMTIHAAKGKEFDHVYLIGLVEDELPSFQARKRGEHSLAMEEERRNCFVAMTRARETLTLSYAESYQGWDKEPSRFLREAGAEEYRVDASSGLSGV